MILELRLPCPYSALNVVFLTFLFNLQDVDSLGIINLRYCGYVAVAKVTDIDKAKVTSSIKPINIADQPEGGAHALNINRLITRVTMLLCYSQYLICIPSTYICLLLVNFCSLV